MPVREKISKLLVVLDLDAKKVPVAQAEFNMTDFKYGRYNGQKLFFQEIA